MLKNYVSADDLHLLGIPTSRIVASVPYFISLANLGCTTLSILFTILCTFYTSQNTRKEPYVLSCRFTMVIRFGSSCPAQNTATSKKKNSFEISVGGEFYHYHELPERYVGAR